MFPAPSDFFLVFLLHSQHLPWCIECYNHREDCRNITRIIYFIELTIYCQPAETPCLQFPQQPNLSWVMNSKWQWTGDLCIFSFMCIYDGVHLTASWKKNLYSLLWFTSFLALSFSSSPSHTAIKHQRFRHKRGAGFSSAKNCGVFDRKASRLGEHPSGAPLSLSPIYGSKGIPAQSRLSSPAPE